MRQAAFWELTALLARSPKGSPSAGIQQCPLPWSYLKKGDSALLLARNFK